MDGGQIIYVTIPFLCFVKYVAGSELEVVLHSLLCLTWPFLQTILKWILPHELDTVCQCTGISCDE